MKKKKTENPYPNQDLYPHGILTCALWRRTKGKRKNVKMEKHGLERHVTARKEIKLVRVSVLQAKIIYARYKF